MRLNFPVLLRCVVGIFLLARTSLSVMASPPPPGTAPVIKPMGGFGIDGDLLANTPTANVGDWLSRTSIPGSGSNVLDSAGVPVNPTATFHFIDPYGGGSDQIFVGGLKWTDDPNSWRSTSGKSSAKTDINNVLLHIGNDSDGHTWTIISADRASTSGDSYIDFEFLQNSLTRSNTAFISAGPHGGRTTNDLLLSLAFTIGGNVADFFVWRWQATGSAGYAYVDVTSMMPAGRVFAALNSNSIAVPYGAFGETNYEANAFAEAAIDLTALLGNFNPCLSIGFKSIMVKTKASQSGSASIEDFIDPIQYTLQIGPRADAGADQRRCLEGSSTAFPLNGVATPGLQPVASTTWSVVSGTATVDSPTSLVTTAHVSSASATLRLTVVQANGCTETDDVVLTVGPLPSCSLTGPAVVCPASSTQFHGPAGMGSYAWTISGNGSISGSTNSKDVTVTAGSACGTNFTLILTVNSNACSSQCSMEVMVNDTTTPTIVPPADLILECPADTRTNVTGVATAQDDCGQVTVSFSDALTPGCGGTRVIARTWTVVDQCGNSTNAVQTITVRDTLPPSVIAPPNVVLECPAIPTTNVTGVAAATDGCSAVILTYSDSVSNSCGAAQVITRRWTAVDECGNSGSATQTITIRDITRPSLILPENVVLECPADTSTNNTGVAVSQDGCGSVTLAYSDVVSNSCAGAKVILRTWTATDECGNSTNGVQTVTVRDTVKPVLTVPADLVLECPADTSTNATGIATVTDACSEATISFTDVVTNDCGGTKIIYRTWTAADECGNSISAVQTISVRDLTSPSLLIPADVVLECPGDTRTNVTGVAIAQDGCGSATVTFSDIISNSCGGTRVIARTWTATDQCGNGTNAIQTITVRDTTPPSVTAPPNLVLECPAVTTTNITGVATAHDGCGSVTLGYSDSVSNACGGTEVITRLWTAIDECGNSASAIQTITVRDTTAPSISAPPSLVLDCPATTTTNVTGVASVSDSCGSVVLNYSDVVSNSCGGTKVIGRTWTAVDECGNTTNALQTITVRDITPPTLIIPGDVVLECPAITTTNVTGLATATDGCGSVTVSYSDVVSNSCGGTKIIFRTWVATDDCGNNSSGVQTVTVRDTKAPAIIVPASLVLECPASTTTNETGVAIAEDGCGSVTVIYSDVVSNSCGGTKIIFRTWTAIDQCDNTTNALQTITVRDTIRPSLVLPANVVLECPVTDTSTNVTGVPVAQDGCGSVIVSYSDAVSNSCGGTKIIARTWTAVDQCGNTTNGVQTITVRDTVKPSLIAPPNLVLECPANTTTNATGVATAQDGCSAVTLRYSDVVSNQCGSTKVITRTWTATDQCGNTTNATQLITVRDTIAPVITCPVDVALECGASTAPSATGTATATDGCSTATVSYSDVVTNSCGGSRTITRTWTATDGCGNTASCIQTIFVRDTTPPQISCVLIDTVSQGGYGGGGEPAQILDANFITAFPTGLTIGIHNPGNGTAAPNGLLWQPNAAGLAALKTAISQGGGSGTSLSQDAVNPTDTFGGGGLARQTITLTLNIGFNSSGALGIGPNNFGSLIYTNSGDSLSGLTVSQILDIANRALAGLGLPAGYDFSSLNGLINNLNVAFHDYAVSPWTVNHLGTPALVFQCASQVSSPDPGSVRVSDVCSSPVTLSALPDVITDYSCPNRYTIVRTWLATDACGNTNTCSYPIIVNDTLAPALSRPADVILECPADTRTNVTGTATAQDQCGPAAVSYSDVASNSCGGTKVIFRTWTATDECGNSASAVQTITVRDTARPTIAAPADLVLDCPAVTTTNVTGVATAQDACSAANISYSDSVSNNCGGTKVIYRTWTATDQCGNNISAVQTITVRDITPPTLTAPPNLVLDCPAITTTNLTGVATAQDGCSAVSISYSDIVSSSCGGAKVIYRTWTAVDQCGNSTNALQTITVRDITPPTLEARPNRTVVVGDPWNFDPPTATDGCSAVTVTILSTTTNSTGADTFSATRTWVGTDACGNTNTAQQTISVLSRPYLQALMIGEQRLLLRWPILPSGFQIEFCDNPKSATWTLLSIPSVVSNGFNNVELTPQGNQKLFRLVRPGSATLQVVH
jgi:hypothetical protein